MSWSACAPIRSQLYHNYRRRVESNATVEIDYRIPGSNVTAMSSYQETLETRKSVPDGGHIRYATSNSSTRPIPILATELLPISGSGCDLLV